MYGMSERLDDLFIAGEMDWDKMPNENGIFLPITVKQIIDFN